LQNNLIDSLKDDVHLQEQRLANCLCIVRQPLAAGAQL
jgi:hypothetical protein